VCHGPPKLANYDAMGQPIAQVKAGATQKADKLFATTPDKSIRPQQG